MKDYAGQKYFDNVRPNSWPEWVATAIAIAVFVAQVLLNIPQ